jgi:hypothetical protein
MSNIAWLHVDVQFVDTSVMLLSDMKTGMEHTVRSLYGFNTSRAPDSISHNASHAQALLTSMSFIYRVCHIALSFSIH